MRVADIFEYEEVIVDDEGNVYESVFVDADDNVLSEGAVRQWKRQGGKLVQKYRCLAGKKKGKLVASPSGCGQRKDPKKVRTGRKTMRSKKGIIGRKAIISKRQAISTRLKKMNARLMGKL